MVIQSKDPVGRVSPRLRARSGNLGSLWSTRFLRNPQFREVAAKPGPETGTRTWCRMLPARTARSRSVGTKLTEDEYGRLESLAA
jgi:hypothetical protein